MQEVYAYIHVATWNSKNFNPRLPILFSAPPDCDMFLRLWGGRVHGKIRDRGLQQVRGSGGKGDGKGRNGGGMRDNRILCI